MSRRQRWRLIIRGLLRSLGICALLVVLYFRAPLDRLDRVPVWASLTVAMVALAATTIHQVRAVFKARYPGIRAAEALATTVPLFLLLFAASYFVTAANSGLSFNVRTLTRGDALYFTVTVFCTVGFGDIVATSQTSRELVTVQMILDLIVLGLVVHQVVGAARNARQERLPESGSARQT
jgi:hypothetical protein